MFGHKKYWQIVATSEYIDQVCKLDITIQSNIQNKWIEVAQHKDHREVGSCDDCGSNDEDCPFIVVIFMGLPFEFMYEINHVEHKLTLIDCYKLTFLEHGQTD